MDDLRPRGRGRLVLRTLAIVSALGFLTLVMLQATAFYAPPTPVPTTGTYDTGDSTKAAPVLHSSLPTSRSFDLGVGTKSAPVVPPRLLLPTESREERDDRLYLQATKAGVLGPLKRSQPAPAPQPPATPLPRD